jgi:hypothetical protein
MICIFATPRNLAAPYHLKIIPILAQNYHTHLNNDKIQNHTPPLPSQDN